MVFYFNPGFDLATGFRPDMGERKWLIRLAFLETVAGVPGIPLPSPLLIDLLTSSFPSNGQDLWVPWFVTFHH